MYPHFAINIYPGDSVNETRSCVELERKDQLSSLVDESSVVAGGLGGVGRPKILVAASHRPYLPRHV